MDSLPELAEYFSVILLDPTELGRLSNIFTMSAVEILPNQDPHGVLQIATVSLTLVNGGLMLEENVQFVNYEVTRSSGTFGEVTIAVETTSQSALSTNGNRCYNHSVIIKYGLFPSGGSLSAATSQVFNSSSATVWFFFVASNSGEFLVLGSGSQAVLYAWRGVFTPVQTLTANGVTAFASFTPVVGEDIFVVANGGREGARETSSFVYRLTTSGQLSMVFLASNCTHSRLFMIKLQHRFRHCLRLGPLM